MENLREMLLSEQKKLEEILTRAEEQLKNAPQGSLRLSSSKHQIQYYHSVPGVKKNGRYIPKTEKELISRLAQKSYDEKVVKLAGKRLGQIKRITKDYKEDEIDNLFLEEHIERKKLISPIEPTWEQRLERWMSEKYTGKEFQEGLPVILTEKGERVRSKSEKILADYFYRNKIPYKYEHPLHLKGYGIVYPDFTFLPKKTKKEMYWEHDGKMDDSVYARNAVRKILAYEENGFYPGESLILTFETEKTVLSTKTIERLANKYLL